MTTHRGIRTAARLAAALALAALGGCALGPQREPVASYDLGPPGARGAGRPATIPAMLLVPDVSAPAWLDGNGIVYRLSYDNNARPQAYAGSRWVAPPAALLTQRLRSRLAGASGGVLNVSDGARADYALRVDLEDFSQSFAAADASRVALRARASLVRLADRALMAQQVFAVDKDAPSADARGAVAALGLAGDEFIDALVQWTGEQVRSRGGK
jgi:cholesterol transport system auxiliary component